VLDWPEPEADDDDDGKREETARMKRVA